MSTQRTWAVTGPTSGIGRATALALVPHGRVVLVGRSRERLDAVAREIASAGGESVQVVADMADLASVRRAADELAALDLDGIHLNAGVRLPDTQRTPEGHNLTVMTNVVGPFALTEALAPRLRDGAHLVYTVSAVEDAARRPASLAGFRGGRYLSAADMLAGRWAPGGSTNAGFDAYATSKQALLAAVLALAEEQPRLRFDAVEPGIVGGTGLEAGAPAPARLIGTHVMPRLAGRVPYLSTTDRAARVFVDLLTDGAGTGRYLDEQGRPMHPSAQVQEPVFRRTVLSQLRELVAGM